MSDDMEQARAARREILPQDPEITAPTGSAAERLERITWAEGWQRPGLSTREKRLITLTVLGINGGARSLALHLRGALDSGDLTAEDLDAFFFHFALYAGLPRGSVFAEMLGHALDERAAT